MLFIIRYPRIFLTLVAVVALLPGIFQLPLMDRDEPRFSHATIEMMDRNEWIVPYFNDEYRFDKPPLTYWWMRLHYNIFGKHEFAARLHSTFSAWIIALLIFSIGKKVGLSRDRAVLAGSMWLCSFQVLIHGRMAVADMPLILFLVISQWAQWELLTKRDGKVFGKWFWIFHLSVAMGFLAKGPLAYIIPVLSLLLYLVFTIFTARPADKSVALSSCYKTIGITLLGIPISLGLVALWGVPAMIKTDYQYFNVGIGTHVVERGTGAMNNRQVHYWIYLVYMIPFLLPWSAQLTSVVNSGFKGLDLGRASNYLIAWFIAPFLIFSFYATQLPHYILPGYPAFMLILAGFIGRPFRRSPFGKILSCLATAIPWILFTGMLIAFLLCPSTGEIAPMKGLFGSLGLLMLFLGFAAIIVLRNKEHAGWRALTFALVASLCMIPAGYFARQAHATVRLMEYLSPDRSTERAAWGFQEGSLIWYPSDFWTLGNPDNTPAFKNADEMVFQTKRWRIDDDFISALTTGDTPQPVDDHTEKVAKFMKEFKVNKVGTIQGWNPGSSSWVEIVIAERPKAQ